MKVRLEHANLIVRDVDAMIRFLQTAFPSFRVRAEGKGMHGDRWVHARTSALLGSCSISRRFSNSRGATWRIHTTLPFS